MGKRIGAISGEVLAVSWQNLTPGAQVAQARNMSIGERRHYCVTFEIQGFVWEKNLSFLQPTRMKRFQ